MTKCSGEVVPHIRHPDVNPPSPADVDGEGDGDDVDLRMFPGARKCKRPQSRQPNVRARKARLKNLWESLSYVLSH